MREHGEQAEEAGLVAAARRMDGWIGGGIDWRWKFERCRMLAGAVQGASGGRSTHPCQAPGQR